MDVLLVFVVVLQTVGRIECSNLEVRLPMVKEGPMDSLFGFSVAEHIVSMKEPTLSDNYDGSLWVLKIFDVNCKRLIKE